MFTGIVTDIGEIVHVEERGALHRLAIRCSYPLESIALGASIACSGDLPHRRCDARGNG